MANAQTTQADAAPVVPDRLSYFMLRIRRVATDPAADCAGVVERLGTGEKRTFKGSTELAQLIEEWSR